MSPTVSQIVAEAVRLSGVKGLTETAILSGSMRDSVVRVRQRAALAIRRLRPDLSTPRIGRALSKDHTTILLACRREEALLAEDAEEREAFTRLMSCFPPPPPDTSTIADHMNALQLTLQEALVQLAALGQRVAAERRS